MTSLLAVPLSSHHDGPNFMVYFAHPYALVSVWLREDIFDSLIDCEELVPVIARIVWMTYHCE